MIKKSSYNKILNIKLIIILLMTISLNSFAYQSDLEILLKTSHQCSKYLDYYEQRYNLPKRILYSISLTETGRFNKDINKLLPWPWAVNQGGKAFYFDNKIEAIKAVRKMQKEGITNIDVGCMQVNMRYHGQNFTDLMKAFDPKSNIEFAAQLLRKHYDKFSCWKKTIIAYHSMSDLGKEYYKKVLKIWQDNHPTPQNLIISATNNKYKKQGEFYRQKFYHLPPRRKPQIISLERRKSNLMITKQPMKN